MDHPYLIPADPDSADFVAALARCAQDGREVEVERLSAGVTHTFRGMIVSVTASEDRCLVKREDRAPESYWIRYLFGVVHADGVKTASRAALAKQQEELAQRARRTENSQRVLVDTGFEPEALQVTSDPAGTLSGEINNIPSRFYAFMGRSSKPVAASSTRRARQLRRGACGFWTVKAAPGMFSPATCRPTFCGQRG